jgi:hypothetical protein
MSSAEAEMQVTRKILGRTTKPNIPLALLKIG